MVEITYSRSTVTLTLATLMVLLTHYYGVKMRGTGAYLKSFVQPVAFMVPFKIVEEFASTLTLVYVYTVIYSQVKYYLDY